MEYVMEEDRCKYWECADLCTMTDNVIIYVAQKKRIGNSSSPLILGVFTIQLFQLVDPHT